MKLKINQEIINIFYSAKNKYLGHFCVLILKIESKEQNYSDHVV